MPPRRVGRATTSPSGFTTAGGLFILVETDVRRASVSSSVDVPVSRGVGSQRRSTSGSSRETPRRRIAAPFVSREPAPSFRAAELWDLDSHADRWRHASLRDTVLQVSACTIRIASVAVRSWFIPTRTVQLRRSRRRRAGGSPRRLRRRLGTPRLRRRVRCSRLARRRPRPLVSLWSDGRRRDRRPRPGLTPGTYRRPPFGART